MYVSTVYTIVLSLLIKHSFYVVCEWFIIVHGIIAILDNCCTFVFAEGVLLFPQYFKPTDKIHSCLCRKCVIQFDAMLDTISSLLITPLDRM